MTLTASENLYLAGLVTNHGYRLVRAMPGNRYAAVTVRGEAWTIVSGRIGAAVWLCEAWRYPSERKALAALDAWDGTGIPPNGLPA